MTPCLPESSLSLMLPLVNKYGGGCRFIETEVTRHKTAPRASRKPLPCVCLADGISGANWAEGWLEGRAAMVSMLQLTAVFKGLHVRMALGASAP